MSDSPNTDAVEERTTVTIRRAPRFSTFVVVGALFGFLVTLVVTSLFPSDPTVGFAASLGFFALFGIPIGAVIAAVIALAIDRYTGRHTTKVIAGKLAVHVDDEFALDDDNTPETQQ